MHREGWLIHRVRDTQESLSSPSRAASLLPGESEAGAGAADSFRHGNWGIQLAVPRASSLPVSL